ncbi:hypothetical protein ACIA59_21855 [Micromonospora haikouensis]|uniref:hypothetical protein n=1 Tax=Micromonospora haikouensis TaxID=686309 RepID=UPI00378C3004
MTVVDSLDGEKRLAPVPHGAAARSDDHRALPIPQATRPEHVAVARFQVMAALGLGCWMSHYRPPEPAVVVGGGPVALGCILELKNRGVARVVMVTRHPQPAAAVLPGVAILADSPGAETQSFVIDCTGRAGRAFAMVAPGGFLGLLGTSDGEEALSATAVHRRGAAVVGMHELAGHCDRARQAAFAAVLRKVTTTVDIDSVKGWFNRIPGEQAVPLYAALASSRRPTAPFVVLEWS